MRQTDSSLLGVEDAAHSDLAHPNHLPLAPCKPISRWSICLINRKKYIDAAEEFNALMNISQL
jgi:hypothetical protein